ncbi:MAG: hypothetical protein KatS3mg031_2731 [Chitinophagales bacterium]|nr:MAG: hypothetical protein KatS3mg031_2731 [Chitinophagales bacterium]
MRIIRDSHYGSEFDRHFREKFLKHSEMPDPELWDKIASRLDEERNQLRHDHWYKAILLFLLPLTMTNLWVSYRADLQKYLAGIMPKVPQQLAATETNNKPIDFPKASVSHTVTNEVLHTSASVVFSAEAPKVTETLETMRFAGHLSDFIPGTHTPTTISNPFSPKAIINSSPDPSFPLAQSEKFSARGFHFGIEGGLNSNLMLPKLNSYPALITGESKTKFDYGPAFGISAGYDFSDRLGIEVEYIIKSVQGYRYSENRHNKIFIDGEINLDYMHVPMMIKYKLFHNKLQGARPGIFNVLAGVQYSRLTKAIYTFDNHTLYENDSQNVEDQFNRNELGFLLGVEYDFYLSKNYFVSLGARASYSKDVNYYTTFQDWDNRPNSFLIGITGSFHYLMKPKKRPVQQKGTSVPER